jgi:hypothetical protein
MFQGRTGQAKGVHLARMLVQLAAQHSLPVSEMGDYENAHITAAPALRRPDLASPHADVPRPPAPPGGMQYEVDEHMPGLPGRGLHAVPPAQLPVGSGTRLGVSDAPWLERPGSLHRSSASAAGTARHNAGATDHSPHRATPAMPDQPQSQAVELQADTAMATSGSNSSVAAARLERAVEDARTRSIQDQVADPGASEQQHAQDESAEVPGVADDRGGESGFDLSGWGADDGLAQELWDASAAKATQPLQAWAPPLVGAQLAPVHVCSLLCISNWIIHDALAWLRGPAACMCTADACWFTKPLGCTARVQAPQELNRRRRRVPDLSMAAQATKTPTRCGRPRSVCVRIWAPSRARPCRAERQVRSAHACPPLA